MARTIETNVLTGTSYSPVDDAQRDIELTEHTTVSTAAKDPTPVRDSGWYRQAFHVRPRNATIDNSGMSRTAMRNSKDQFYDTTLGGYRAINPTPQFTRFADVKSKPNNVDSRGHGRYHNEAFNANAQIIHMRFGLPEYNSLSNFLSGMYDVTAGKLARTGEGSSLLATIAGAAGYVISIPLRVLTGSAQSLMALFTNIPYNKFYYSKPAMPLYYNAVTVMLTKLAVNMKLLGGGELTDENKNSGKGKDANNEDAAKPFILNGQLTPAARKQMHELMPDIFNADTGFDIYAVSTRYQRLANQQEEATTKIINDAKDAEDAAKKLAAAANELLVDRTSAPATIIKYVSDFLSSPLSGNGLGSTPDPEPEPEGNALTRAFAEGSKMAMDVVRQVGEWFAGSAELMKAEEMGGSQWVSFKVESTGTQSESFSNSTADSALAGKINSASSGARAAKFNMAGGNVGSSGFSDVLEFAAGTVSGVLGAVGNAVGLGGFGALMGGGFVDIPKYWENSTAQLSKGDYSLKLRAMYGNKLSIFKDIYVPMCMLLGAALPMSTGTNTYTSPFLVELFDQGRVQTRLGMIDSLSITRGTGNLGWSTDGLPTGIDISFSVIDLSSVMHMPVARESLSFNDHSVFNDYMAALGGLGALEQLTVTDRFKRKQLLLSTAWDQWWSPTHFANWWGDTAAGRLIGAARNNAII